MSSAIPIRITFDGRLWRIGSADGRLSGAFVDRRTAERQAEAEADAHGGYRCVFGRR